MTWLELSRHRYKGPEPKLVPWKPADFVLGYLPKFRKARDRALDRKFKEYLEEHGL